MKFIIRTISINKPPLLPDGPKQGGLLTKHQDLRQILPTQGGFIIEGGLLIEIVLMQ